jgi:hypothetical protein
MNLSEDEVALIIRALKRYRTQLPLIRNFDFHRDEINNLIYELRQYNPWGSIDCEGVD